MEWLKEMLKNAGFDEGKIDEFVTNFNKEVPKHLIPKEKYNELAETRDKLEGDIAERDKQLETLKKSSGDSKALQEQIDQLQQANKEAKEAYEKEAKELQTNTAIKLQLAGKVHDPDIVLGQIDKSKIELDDDGNIKTGFDDQIKSLQESKAFLFVPEKDGKPQFQGFKPFEGKNSGSDGETNNIGKQLAQQNKQSSQDVSKAQANYFGGAGNE